MKNMECGINFRSPESQAEYFAAYEKTMGLFSIEVQEAYVHTEFAFDIRKAERRARKCVQNLELEIVKDASHLIPVSKPDYINKRIMGFLED